MSLIVSKMSYIHSKILIVAQLCGVQLTCQQLGDVVDKPSHSCSPSDIILRTEHGWVTQSNTIIKYIAGCFPGANLVGCTLFDESFVDEWLETIWTEIGMHAHSADAFLLLMIVLSTDVPIHAVQRCHNKAITESVKEKLQNNLHQILLTLDTGRLRYHTFVATDRISVVDVSLYVSVSEALRLDLISSFEKFGNVMRWFYTVGSHESVVCICPLPS